MKLIIDNYAVLNLKYICTPQRWSLKWGARPWQC